MSKIEWVIEQHRKTNHFYDLYLPYEFHLRMVVQVANDFMSVLTLNDESGEGLILAAWGHDLIEDTRTSYNDVRNVLGEKAADIIYALTNEKGKTRGERANDKYYEGIRNTGGAVFVKLCDRIANVQYSKMTKSKMFEVYRAENESFAERLRSGYRNLDPMFKYLENLLF